MLGELVDLRAAGGAKAEVYYRPGFLDPAEADAAYEALRPGGGAGVDWDTREIRIGGRVCRENRLTALFGETDYKYSGSLRRVGVDVMPFACDATGTIGSLVSRVSEAAGVDFNFVLANCYTPDSSISAHSDDEKGLVPGTPIASLSLGRERRFIITPRTSAAETKAAEAKAAPPPKRQCELRLAHGSLLCMMAGVQSVYKHAVPAERKNEAKVAATQSGFEYRVNLTFRCVARKN